MTRKTRGAQAHAFGLSGEDIALRHYEARGFRLFARRWRQSGAEIDLIVQNDSGFVCVEVKAGTSSLSFGQKTRLLEAAEAFILSQGAGAECRFDLALVSGSGEVNILENALFS